MAGRPRVVVAFEHPTLNGGERSLLACEPALSRRFDLIAVGPSTAGGDLSPLHHAWAAAGHGLVPGTVRGLAAAYRTGGPDPLRTLRPDLIHANGLAAARLLGRDRAALPCPVTGHLRDIVNLSKRATADLSRCDRLVAVSRAARDHHVARGVPADRVAVVHNGVDPAAFAAGLDRADCRRSVRAEFGLPADAPVVLAVGQIILRKGWDVLATAAAGLPGGAHVLCVGARHGRKAETVGHERAVFETFDRTAPGRAHRLGTRADVARLMLAADVLAHPARQEPFGRVLLEAAAVELPVVACPVGGTPEMLGDAYAPVPPGDADALAAALTRLLAGPAERARLAAAARARVARFTVEAAADGLAAVWDDVLAGGASGGQ